MHGRNGPRILSVFLLSLYGANLVADDTSSSSSSAVSITEAPAQIRTRSARQWSVFGGVGAGYGAVFSNEFSGSAHGNQYLISGGVSYQLSRWVFDGGIGWMYTQLQGKSVAQDSLQMRTRTGLIELSPRFRLTQRWQLGPVLNFAFGTDTSFAPRVGTSALSTFAGLKGVYQLPLGAVDLRLWQQISTDASISNRQTLFTVVGVQVDIPVSWAKRTHYAVSKPVAPLNKVEIDDIGDPLTRGVVVSGIIKDPHEVRIKLDPQKVFFGTNSAQVKPEVGSILKTVGEYLATNPTSWKRLDVDGHADQRGSFQYNLTLSRKRSHSVVEAMTLTTADTTSKINQKGYSFSKPLDPRQNQEAWTKNRRVELVFTGVEDPAALVERLKALKPLTQGATFSADKREK